MKVSTDNEFPLDNGQWYALEQMFSGRNVFLTGKAGTGKSAVIHAFTMMCGKTLVLLAPTGRAALNIHGDTIHRFFHLPVGATCLEKVGADMADEELRAKLNAVDVILVDEISMVPSYIFHEMDRCFRSAAYGKNKDLPFGGKQIIVVGDFHQLGPVVSDPTLQKWINENFGGNYAFNAPAWEAAGFVNVALEQVHRQSVAMEIEVLDALRTGNLNCPVGMINSKKMLDGGLAMERNLTYLDLLNKMCYKPNVVPHPHASTLCSRRYMAHIINDRILKSLNGAPETFYGSVIMGFPADEFPTSITLPLKIGSRITVLINIPESQVVNGSMGTLVGKQGTKAVVQLDNRREVALEPFRWTSFSYELLPKDDGTHGIGQKVNGYFTNVPLASSYAQTIHRAQGMTLDHVHIALGNRNCFATGQPYTAFTRSRTLAHTSVDRKLRAEECLPDPVVVEFYRKIARSCRGNRKEMN